WNNLGNLLKSLKRYDKAEEAFRKAIEINKLFSLAWLNLIRLQLEFMAAYELAYKSVDQFLKDCGRSAENLNTMALCFFQYAPKDHLNEAESWSREAVQKVPDNPDYQHTLASILGRLGNWDEALKTSLGFFESEEFLERGSNDITEFFISASVAGFGEDSLRILEQYSNKPTLEPLITGIKIYLGKKVRTAQEIMEIGKDVAKRIERRLGESEEKDDEYQAYIDAIVKYGYTEDDFTYNERIIATRTDLHPLGGEITITFVRNGIKRLYTTGPDSRWAADFEADLKAGVFEKKKKPL
ncbi:MAG: tetratricopeptide repeat protein, partial [Deltaproteobacteria bacterium]|nr:tetratricopeptide repeat protein [Deltaproteobacteria bacterium]